MATIRKYFNCVFMLFFAYLLLLTSVGRSAEPTLSIRQIQLQQRLNRLAIIIAQSKQELNLLDNQLATSQTELTTAKTQLVVLKDELQKLEQTSAKQNRLLENAKQYSKKLEKNQSPLTLDEYSVRLSFSNTLEGIAYGRYWKMPQRPVYCGVRGTYEWRDKETGLWVSLLI